MKIKRYERLVSAVTTPFPLKVLPHAIHLLENVVCRFASFALESETILTGTTSFINKIEVRNLILLDNKTSQLKF